LLKKSIDEDISFKKSNPKNEIASGIIHNILLKIKNSNIPKTSFKVHERPKEKRIKINLDFKNSKFVVQIIEIKKEAKKKISNIKEIESVKLEDLDDYITKSYNLWEFDQMFSPKHDNILILILLILNDISKYKTVSKGIYKNNVRRFDKLSVIMEEFNFQYCQNGRKNKRRKLG
jgi:hypothetical protein